jgi:hypothetical protein
MAEEKTKEEVATEWEDYVRSEVNALLDMYLPLAKNGNIGIKYYKDVKSRSEVGPVFDETKAVGVQMHLVFEFAAPVELVGDEPAE